MRLDRTAALCALAVAALLQAGLAPERTAPKIVLLDDDIAYFSEKATASVRAHYRPGPVADVWVRIP